MSGLPLLDQITLGDHVCWFVDDDAIRMEAIAGFVRTGLRNHERVLYSGDDPAAVVEGLEQRGVDTGAALAAGQLIAGTAEDSYLAVGFFDPDTTMRLWRDEVARAHADGYRGIRVLGDMTWASRGLPGTEHLPWYEAQINRIFAEGYVAGVCAYDPRCFGPRQMRDLLGTHPGTAGPQMPFDPDASLRMRRTREPSGLRLEGEADLANRDALRAVAEHLFDDGPDVTIDVSGLRFADLSAARVLVDAAASGAGRVRLTGCSPSLIRLLRFHGTAGVPGLTVEAR